MHRSRESPVGNRLLDALPDDERYGILPKGRIMKSPDGSFFLQLIEPRPGNLGPRQRKRRR